VLTYLVTTPRSVPDRKVYIHSRGDRTFLVFGIRYSVFGRDVDPANRERGDVRACVCSIARLIYIDDCFVSNSCGEGIRDQVS
jgi:hypothetical protein